MPISPETALRLLDAARGVTASIEYYYYIRGEVKAQSQYDEYDTMMAPLWSDLYDAITAAEEES